MKTKTCTACKEELPHFAFTYRKTAKGRAVLRDKCKACEPAKRHI